VAVQRVWIVPRSGLSVGSEDAKFLAQYDGSNGPVHCNKSGLLRGCNTGERLQCDILHSTWVVAALIQAAHQLSDLSRTIRVESSSTGDPFFRGALPNREIPTDDTCSSLLSDPENFRQATRSFYHQDRPTGILNDSGHIHYRHKRP